MAAAICSQPNDTRAEEKQRGRAGREFLVMKYASVYVYEFANGDKILTYQWFGSSQQHFFDSVLTRMLHVPQ